LEKNRHSFELNFPNGYSIYAWLEQKDEGQKIAIQWREPSGKPAHQPFWLDLKQAPNVLEQIAGFARHVDVEIGE